MSLTVVGATLLAAICCKQLRSESKQQAKTLQSELQLAKKILTKSTTIREPQLTSGQDNLNDHVNGFEFIQRLASLCDEAIATSVWCTVSDLILFSASARASRLMDPLPLVRKFSEHFDD